MADEHNVLKPQEKLDMPKQHGVPTRMLMTKPEVSKNIMLNAIPTSMVRTKNGTLIMCHTEPSTISIVRPKSILTWLGIKSETTVVGCDIDIFTIAIKSSTDELYCLCWGREGVRSLNMKGKTHKLFDLPRQYPDAYPGVLAVTPHSSNIIIGDNSRPTIHIYTMDGIKLQTIECYRYMLDFRQRAPRDITVCSSTGKIAVACANAGVIVLDDKYNVLYTCSGAYGAVGAAFDRYGYLLVAGFDDYLHVLNAASGTPMQYISRDIIQGYVECLVTQNNDELAVCISGSDHDSRQSIKYLQDE